ncbi:MAG: SDR family oxidoreductase [Albidovulum sp.]|nr:SDR family oxidoreductase [Albidovulum sp.]
MKEKCIVISGSSSGIGAALARRLAGKVGSMVLHARSARESLDSVAADVEKAGTRTAAILCDLADGGSAEKIIELAADKFGRIDGLVANAGFPLMKSFSEGEASDIEYAFRANLFSFFEFAKCAHPYLKQAQSGRLIALGSFTAHVFRTDLRSFPMSAASKGGLETAVRSVALAMCKDGITVNCVVPGFIWKEKGTRDGLSEEELIEVSSRIPLGRPGYPDEVAAVIEFFLSEESNYVTGQCLHVNGGLT